MRHSVAGREYIKPLKFYAPAHQLTIMSLCFSVVHPNSRVEVLAGMYNGDTVSVYAHPASGGYVMMLGIVVIFSLTTPGAVLASSFLPGFRIGLIIITVILLAACASPIVYYTFFYFSVYWTNSDTHLRDCLTNIPRVDNTTTIHNAGSNFVELVGWAITDQALLCTPATVSILPQMGLFQTLALSLFSEIVFYSNPEDYADQFVNQLIEGGASCSYQKRQCTFNYATDLFGKNVGFMSVGAIILTVMGMMMTTLTIYPTMPVIRAKHFFGNLWTCRWLTQNLLDSEVTISEMFEVDSERQKVHMIMQPFLAKQPDPEANDSEPTLSKSYIVNQREKLPPVIMHKLRKQFPPLGGAPAKVALASLDLHVPVRVLILFLWFRAISLRFIDLQDRFHSRHRLEKC